MNNHIENFFSLTDAEDVEARLYLLQEHFIDAKDSYDSQFIVETLQIVRELVSLVKYLESKDDIVPALKRVS